MVSTGFDLFRLTKTIIDIEQNSQYYTWPLLFSYCFFIAVTHVSIFNIRGRFKHPLFSWLLFILYILNLG